MAGEFNVTSSSVAEGGKFDKRHTCKGEDRSIALTWSGAPGGTQAYAIIMDDPDARSVAGYTWVHWNVFNIPAEVTDVAEGAAIPGASVALNHFKRRDYGGPCPPRGSHKYFTAVYALSAPFDEAPGGPLTRETFEKEFANRILAKAELSANFP